MLEAIIILICVFVVSIGLNLIQLWYTKNVLTNFIDTMDNLKEVTDEIILFDRHLKEVYELEMFYGDETLNSLLKHSKALSEMLTDFIDIYAITDEEVDEEQEEEEPEDMEVSNDA